MSHSSPVLHRRAPRAEPEEDIDVPESGAEDETLPENKVFCRSAQTADATKLETQESTRIGLHTPLEIQEEVTELEQVAKLSEALKAQDEFPDPYEDASPPPLLLSNLATEECFEGFSSLEGEVTKWITNGEMICDHAENVTSSDHNTERPEERLPLNEMFDREVDPSGEDMAKDENITQLSSYSLCEHGINKSGGASPGINSAHKFNNLNDVCAAHSPPFADEREGEEEVSSEITPCLQQFSMRDVQKEHFQMSFSASNCVSSEQASNLPEVPSDKQQKELLSQGQSRLVPRGENQEAVQQVRDRDSQPLSIVAMVLSKQGGASSQGSGCVVAFRERRSRAGERTEVESEQTGEEEKQRETGPERSRVVLPQHSRDPKLLVRTQKLKVDKSKPASSKKTNRMESDSSDDSVSDSGVSADSSQSSSQDGNVTLSTTVLAVKETPIEREIRRSIEREHSLRRSRGLPNPSAPEYVEIPLGKAVLYQSVTSYAERSQGKDRQFAGNKMLHEIHEEIQREQDLVDSGKIPGYYDKGSVSQLKERKQLFEAFQKPSNKNWVSAACDVSTLENMRDMSLQASATGGSYVEHSHRRSQKSAKGGDSTYLISVGSGPSDRISSRVIIHESFERVPVQNVYHTKSKTESITLVDPGRPEKSSKSGRRRGVRASEKRHVEKEVEVSPRENPFFKLRSSATLVKVEQDIREAQERERELRKQRISLYRGKESERRVRSAAKEERSRRLSSSSSSSSSSSASSLSEIVGHAPSPRRITGPPAG